MKAELVVIPSPGVGHIVSTLEIAKLLVDRDDRLSITVLLMKSPFDPKATTDVQSIAASCATDRIRFIELPDLHRDDESDQENKPKKSFSSLLEEQKPHVKEAVAKRALSDSPRLAGFVVDMFCTTMIDVADEFGLPSYVFFTSGAAFLGLLLHLQALHDEQNVDVTEFKDSDAELAVPSLVNPLPAKVLPSSFLSKEWVPYLFGHARKFREANGIMVNTFFELESRALTSISDGKIPPVFPVGPLLNLKGDHGTGDAGKAADIMEWLDDQPQSSVVFLCFGSMGSFDEVQVKEIACALEQSGYRFLWSLRKPPPKEKFMYPSDYTDPREALPEGFLDRTVEKGKVIGWAPQVDVLAHPAIGGFVSHCGWNSTLESVWFGVPMATWPLYAEQQFNAFELVIELGLAVEIKMDYRKDFLSDPSVTVSAAEIERGIRCLMDQDNAVRKKVKQMSENSRLAVMEGGSSHSAVGRFIQDVMGENTHN